MGEKRRFFIFGATGYIGHYLYSRLVEDGYNVVGFSRSNDKYGFSFNLLEFDRNKSNIPIKHGDLAIVTIAQCKIDQCFLDYDAAYDVNITKTLDLVDYLCGRGSKVILFSSDNVFGDNRGNYKESDPVCPINKYGEMKAELERIVLERYQNVCIFRLPKVYGLGKEKNNMLFSFLCESEGGAPLRCIKGTKMSVVSQEDIYQACIMVRRLDLKGLYNLAEDECYSRKELALIAILALGLDREIIEIPIDQFNFADNRPLVISMRNEKFVNETNFKFHNYRENVRKFMERLNDKRL